ncbi:hypothetical protein [Candidatus Neptunochlamydia vexilliferae]|uniref:Uncharacterized protein n=1 Tax=Candidatus Neptunichlamydia vexilliferae TaxID=1651774 RepID=A0ABS0B304_9BACT|nr:hypothetical protein [Candidatus Neptunochlamydia vexilliferae]MBF5059950.1 hypothetical protein [Candidatus Neptunochlamydia vexilliferae]
MKLSHRNAILFSGLLWFGVGILLLTKGIGYLVEGGNAVLAGTHQGFSLIQQMGRFSNDPKQGALILICLALLVGFFKGRVVLKKTVNRIVNRIRSYPSPISLKEMYPKSYFFLIGGMMGMGMVFKFLSLPLDVKGFVDFTIGAALINGAMLYLRAAFAPAQVGQ